LSSFISNASPLFEIARVLVRFDHVARGIVNESQRDVSGCETSRMSLRWWQELEAMGDDPEKFSAFLQPCC